MKRAKMIKALIITHLWSLLIALSAWALQRDKGGRPGAYFPTPAVWLGLIFFCFLPGLISLLPVSPPITLPSIEIFETDIAPSNVEQNENVWSIDNMTIYFTLACLLSSHTLFRWARLQFIPVNPTCEPDVFSTSSNLPPLTLSWPRSAIIVPDGLQNHAALIRHERSHLRHHDAEITLCLLIARDLLLHSFGFSYLVRQWRLSIELRADYAATEMLSTSERKDYAALLLNGLRPGGDHAGGRTLPCPTAHLTSTSHRSFKMRLTEIMDNKSKPRKRRWSAALLTTAIGAGMLGLLSTNAIADDNQRIVQVNGVNIKHTGNTRVFVTPQMPDSCPGLEINDNDISERTIMVDDKVVKHLHLLTVGVVDLKYDVRTDGHIENISVVKSNHPCFEPNAITAVAQRKLALADQQKTKSLGKAVNDVPVTIKFTIGGETREDFESKLNLVLK